MMQRIDLSGLALQFSDAANGLEASVDHPSSAEEASLLEVFDQTRGQIITFLQQAAAHPHGAVLHFRDRETGEAVQKTLTPTIQFDRNTVFDFSVRDGIYVKFPRLIAVELNDSPAPVFSKS